MPWWAGLLLFASGIIIGMLIVIINDSEDQPTFKYIKRR